MEEREGLMEKAVVVRGGGGLVKTGADVQGPSCASPDGVEPHTYTLVLGEVGDERQV